MDERCYKHPFEEAEGLCKNCGWQFCSECLVYAFGPKQPPLCLSCALAKAGVRSNAARPPARSKREMRKQERAFRKRSKTKSATETVAAGSSAATPIDLEIPAGSSPAFDWVNDVDTDQPGSNLVSF